MQRAKHCGFGQLLAQLGLDLARRQYAAALEQLPDMGDERGDAIGARSARCTLPVAIAAEGVDKGQRLGAYEKVGMIGLRAEEIERQSGVGLDQPHEQVFRTLDRCARRRWVGLTLARLDERRSRSGNLSLAGKEKA